MFDRSADQGRPLRLTVYGTPPPGGNVLELVEGKVGQVVECPVIGWSVKVDLAPGPFDDLGVDQAPLWGLEGPAAGAPGADLRPTGSLRDLALVEVIEAALTERVFGDTPGDQLSPGVAAGVVARYLRTWIRERPMRAALDDLGATRVWPS